MFGIPEIVLYPKLFTAALTVQVLCPNDLNEANKNNLEPINQLLQILKNPYIYQKNINEYQVPPVSNKKYQTFCGT